jgi:serine/threonine-protein kinase
VKILDFGLAKLGEAPGGEGRGPNGTADPDAPTVIGSTAPGKVMGTPAYMAPEQVRGEAADHRADIFAFGCVLYELLGGARAFRRATAVESMNAILKEEPADLQTLRPELPAALVRIVERCLEKSPDNRFQSAKDLAFALEEGSATSSPVRPVTAPASRPVGALVAAAVAVLALAGGAWWFLFRDEPPADAPPAARPGKSVAVLPFVNLSPDPADEYLSDGLTEELLGTLARVKGLRVPGRSSSFAFKGRREEGLHRRVGEQLRVAAVLEGSVRKAGDRLRVTAQLTSVADGFSLWSETYERDMTNIFAIQGDIAARVAAALRVELLGEAAAAKPPTENLEAYTLYLQGRQLWNRRTGEAITQAIGQFERALALDPAFALAHAGLADCYVILGDYAGLPFAQMVPKVRTAARRALELNPALVEPRVALAQLQAYYDWDWAGAEAEFRRVIELNPNYATAHHWLGNLLNTLKRYPEALAHFRLGIQADPLSPVLQGNEAQALFSNGNEAAAMAMLERLISLHPDFPSYRSTLGELRLRQGRYAAAVAALEEAHRLDPNRTVEEGWRALALVRAGRLDDARHALTRLMGLQERGHDFTVSIALIHHALGEDEEALRWLEQGAERRTGWLEELYRSPHWDTLRPHPRVQAILRKMNLVR